MEQLKNLVEFDFENIRPIFNKKEAFLYHLRKQITDVGLERVRELTLKDFQELGRKASIIPGFAIVNVHFNHEGKLVVTIFSEEENTFEEVIL
ncbi:MAG: hypothetical protein ABIK73_07735 [candidate division WOR-3 bacterium]